MSSKMRVAQLSSLGFVYGLQVRSDAVVIKSPCRGCLQSCGCNGSGQHDASWPLSQQLKHLQGRWLARGKTTRQALCSATWRALAALDFGINPNNRNAMRSTEIRTENALCLHKSHAGNNNISIRWVAGNRRSRAEIEEVVWK